SMPGYNHYPSCTCGWCVKGRMSRSQRDAFERLFPVRDATHLLQQHRVRSRIACYVNPNARCPVCDQPVFFYANAAGSRVFFDDLGPPWPKHPCTDRRGAMERRPIERRSAGLMQELVKAANTIGMLTRPAGQRPGSSYRPVVVLGVERDDTKATITGEYIDAVSREAFRVTVKGTDISLSPGDIIGSQGGIVSYVDPVTLQPMQFRDGEAVEPFHDRDFEPGLAQPTSSLSPRAELIKRRQPAPATRTTREPSGELTRDELRHFGGDEETLGRLLAIYAPLIRQYAREQVRKPKEVCVRLNRERHRTMAGEAWTNRLVFFLLKLLFSDRSPTASQAKPSAGPSIKHAAHQHRQASASRTSEAGEPTLAAKLARLGRVTVGKPRQA
ncbi:MAG: hypothetical protein QHC89_19110, partial [Bosea sp. (in: a-proteobacteria)]|nr:hypothetical protein [Bosea sp. (in: a-proteobacteria)]